MKLGLLVVLAVAVLVPSLSEGRTVSPCELKEKLGEAIVLPRRLQKYKERVLAIVICEMNRRSRLNSTLVRVFGKRTTTTASPTTTTTTTTSPTTTTTTTTSPTTTTTTTTSPTTTTTTTTSPTTTTTTTTSPKTTTTTTTSPTTTTTTTTRPAATEAATANSTQTASGARRKREADEMNEDLVRTLMEQMNSEETAFDEEEMEHDDNTMDDEEGEDSNEDGGDGAKDRKDSVEDGEDSNEGDDENDDKHEQEEGRKREKRGLRHWKPKRNRRPWSIGYYGLFQLSDSHFCYSGYRWSRNLCNTPCTAFSDDDISDDIDCVVKTHYWWYVLTNASRWCTRNRYFLSKCK